jgi:hypothetical protein
LSTIQRELKKGRRTYKQILAALDNTEATLNDCWFVKVREDSSKHGKMGKAGNLVEINC